MSVAFVLSGGASLGAVQVGMLRALADEGIRPDLLVGTSVGAVNGAFLAGRATSPGTASTSSPSCGSASVAARWSRSSP